MFSLYACVLHLLEPSRLTQHPYCEMQAAAAAAVPPATHDKAHLLLRHVTWPVAPFSSHPHCLQKQDLPHLVKRAILQGFLRDSCPSLVNWGVC